MSEEKTITSDKEVLIAHRNKFQKTLLDNILDLRRHEYVKTIKPDFQRANQQGKYIGVDELIKDYKKGAANAKSYVGIIDEMLRMDTAGNLPEAWADISETPKVEETEDDAPKEIEESEKETN